jgi:gamma-glutamyltranspeptidase / glutathione hydrolase
MTLRLLPASRRAVLALLIGVAAHFALHGAATAAERAPGKAAIASAHPLATQAGLDVLKAGGNAFDAAVAVAAALAVVEPSGSGLAGGGLFLLPRAADGRNVVVDAREVAPKAATRDMFLDKSGEPIRGASTNTALAGGIPGEPAGLALLQAKYGRLPMAQSLAPAIRLAKDGFELYPRLQAGLAFKKSQIAKSPDGAKIFLDKQGEALPVGTLLKQPQLARTLQTLATDGVQSFYTGRIAKQLVSGVRELGGIWTAADLADYKAIEREPIVGHYRDVTLISVPPPSSGGIALVEALNVLEGYDLSKFDGVTRKHLIIEAMRRAARDRAVYLGDSAFTNVPVALLTDKTYAAGLRTSIRPDRATPSAALAEANESHSGPNTTHFSIVDAEGNRVAGTITLNAGFGTGLVVRGTGLLLNNQMDDFSIKPGVPNIYGLIGADANEIAPGKRMLSSVTPTFVEGPRGFLIVGSPGGSVITGAVLLATLQWMDGASAQQIVAAPRIHHQYQPDVLMYEDKALTPEEIEALQKRGHQLRKRETWGNLQVVTFDAATGVVSAASDPRGVGTAGLY